MSGLGRGLAIGLRLVALALVVASPWAPPLPRASGRRSVVFVVDESGSIDAAERKRALAWARQAALVARDADTGLVTFGARPTVATPVGAPWSKDPPPASSTPGTDVAAALRLGRAALPPGGMRRLVLLSDGRATRGDALEEARRARIDGVEVDVVTLGRAPSAPPTLGRVHLVESQVVGGAPVEVVAEVAGPAGRALSLTYERDGRWLQSGLTLLDANGRAEVHWVDAAPPAGVHEYRVTAGTPGVIPISGTAAGPTGRAIALVSGRARALVLADGEPPALLREALVAAGIELTVRAPDARVLEAAELSAYDLVVLLDPSVARAGELTMLAGLDAPTQEALVAFAQQGGGVIVTGGAFGFAPEWAGTPLARMLPVRIRDQGELEDPRVAMAIMLDRSGSMMAAVGSHTKLELAIEASLAAASTLSVDDEVAIASVDEVTTWNLPLARAEALPAHVAAVRAVTPGGGGIFVYTALVDAYTALRRSHLPVRHVVLFADTSDSEEQFQGCAYPPCRGGAASALDLASAALGTGITTSVVGIGEPSDSDAAFLRELAGRGAGRFYVTSRATDLRRIFVSETRAATRSNVRDEATALQVAAPHPLLRGVDPVGLSLRGFVQTDRRPTADTVLTTATGEPILATWRYGLGQVVAIPTQLGSAWTESWARDPAGGQLVRQIVRHALRRRAAERAEARLTVHGT